jgi:hypothetical protein
MRLTVFIFFLFAMLSSVAQKRVAYVSGKVIDENETPMTGVSITILGKQNGVITSDSGTYHIQVPAEKAFALVYSYSGYTDEQKNFYLSKGEEEQLTVRLRRTGKTLETVVISN